jgi:hypothetical protein
LTAQRCDAPPLAMCFDYPRSLLPVKILLLVDL